MTAYILIIGAGIGGLAAALSLHQAGHDGGGVRVGRRDPRRSASASTCSRTPCASSTRSACSTALAAGRSQPTTLAYFTKRGEQIWDEPRGRRRRVSLAAGVDPPRHAAADPARRGRRAARRATASTPATTWSASTSRRRPCRRSLRVAARGGPVDRSVRGALRRRRRRHPLGGRARCATPTRACRRGTARCCGAALAEVRAGARRPHDGVGRASAPEVRRLPDRRPARRPPAVQLHRRAAHRRHACSPSARTGTSPAGSTTSSARSRAGASPGSTCPR